VVRRASTSSLEKLKSPQPDENLATDSPRDLRKGSWIGDEGGTFYVQELRAANSGRMNRNSAVKQASKNGEPSYMHEQLEFLGIDMLGLDSPGMVNVDDGEVGESPQVGESNESSIPPLLKGRSKSDGSGPAVREPQERQLQRSLSVDENSLSDSGRKNLRKSNHRVRFSDALL